MDKQTAQRIHGLERQIRRVTRTLETLQRDSDRLSQARLWTAVLMVVSGSVLWFTVRPLALLSLALFGGLFIVLVMRHRRVERSINRHQIWRELKAGHIARATLDWQNIPPARLRVAQPHPLEVDLDLLALHRLLDTTTTQGSRALLREWLLPPLPTTEAILQRQKQVLALIGQSRFRDKLTMLGTESAQAIREGAEGRGLLNWLERQDQPPAQTRRIFFVLLGIMSFNLVAIALILFGVLTENLLLWVGMIAYALVFASQYKHIATVFEDALTIEGALRRLESVMLFLERDQYAPMPPIRTLMAPILADKPSQALRAVTAVISGASLKVNPIIWLMVNIFIPWDYFFAWRLSVVKAQLQARLPRWLDVLHEIEALSALATHAYLNPHYSLPRIGEDLPAALDALGVGHPLINGEARITNDFMLSDLGDMVIITGSNMSGKSSFLRTLGVNLSLAYAGGMVCARGFDALRFRLYTSIRVTDSLDDGISYFYAEVRRLRGLLEAVNTPDAPPVFFLIDEIFRGTNNRERLIGSRSLIRALANTNGVGLIATHDLELAALEQENAKIRNMHFREDVHEGRMVFDYQLRRGASPTTNALRIMALEGLPVDGA